MENFKNPENVPVSLSISSKQLKNRPKESLLNQQKLPLILSNLTGYQFSAILIVIGIIFLPLGKHFQKTEENVYEESTVYDGSPSSFCHITYPNQGRVCEVQFVIPHYIKKNIYVYYELSNFYQNYKRYTSSYSLQQLQGNVLTESQVSLDCHPLLKNGTNLLNPCGLIANSYFNDIFILNSTNTSPTGTFSMSESNIALSSDKSLYKQVNGFQYAEISSLNTSCLESNIPEGCKQYVDPSTQQMYNFYYPNDASVQYLYESYQQISPIKGVTDEHFIVWMKITALPTFRKLYGVINGPFNQGDVLSFNIISNYEITSLSATKAILLTNGGQFGVKNPAIGYIYIITGTLMLVYGIVIGLFEMSVHYKLTKNQ